MFSNNPFSGPNAERIYKVLKRKSYLSFVVFILFFSCTLYAQENQSAHTQKVWRVNFLNPGMELEYPTGDNSTFSTGSGIGSGDSYPD